VVPHIYFRWLRAVKLYFSNLWILLRMFSVGSAWTGALRRQQFNDLPHRPNGVCNPRAGSRSTAIHAGTEA
jgi:hypothetical protein